MNLSRALPILTIAAMLVLVEAIALFLSPSIENSGIKAFENPSSVANPLIFIVILLVFTAFLLLLLKYKGEKFITIIIGVSVFFTLYYIFYAIILKYLDFLNPVIFGITLSLSILSIALLYFFPEWYIIDIFGILICAGAASIFGISLTVPPVIILLVILMVYDAISVYKTKHMITLAEGVIDMKSPILFIVPKRRGYSYIREGIGDISSGERAAFVIGMGDLIMPSILVVSATFFGTTTKYWGFITLPSVGAIIGSVIGLVLLLTVVQKGKPQAGLPPINGGAIIGFLAGYGISFLV